MAFEMDKNGNMIPLVSRQDASCPYLDDYCEEEDDEITGTN
jgi:hypothetical protein